MSSHLLGVSHLVVAVDRFEPWETYLASAGYRRTVHQPGHANPLAKAPFIGGPLSREFEMVFLTGPRGLPAIELLRECNEEAVAPGAPPFSVELGAPQAAPAQACPGVNLIAGGTGATVSVACSHMDAAMAFWRWLGASCSFDQGTGEALVCVGSPLVGGAMALRLHPGEGRGISFLNQRGLVALSFTCRDAAGLREAMAETGAELGECFEIAPLGRPLKVFFVRAPSGEIYEFLSPLPR